MSLLLLFGSNQTAQIALIAGSGTVGTNTGTSKATSASGLGTVTATNSALRVLQSSVASSVTYARATAKNALLSAVSAVTRSVVAGTVPAVSATSGIALNTGTARTLTLAVASSLALSAIAAQVARTFNAVVAMSTSSTASLGQTLIRLRAIAPIDMVLRMLGRRIKLELPGMSTKIDGVFHAGETWLIRGTACDEYGNALDLTGATVQLRIASGDAIVLDLATPDTGSIIDAVNGEYRFLISPAQQTTMLLTSYDYEVRVELSDLTVSVQNHGRIIVKPSKFVNFPR